MSVESLILHESLSADLDDEVERGWVKELHKSWLSVEDAGDRLVNAEVREKQETFDRPYATRTVDGMLVEKKGLIRNLTIVLDMSLSMGRSDYKHTRMAFVMSELSKWIPRFFDRNPLSSLAIVAMREGGATFITRLGGQPNSQLSRLKQFVDRVSVGGKASLGQALDLVYHSYGGVETNSSGSLPGYATKECLVIWGSIASQDSVSLSLPQMQEKLISAQIAVNVVSLEPEVFAVRKLAEISGGSFHVSKNSPHFNELLEPFLHPPGFASLRPQYVKMGFPTRINLPGAGVIRCACHGRLITQAFLCPQCKSPACEIPLACSTCKLTLVDKDMLSGVHRQLYAMPLFTEKYKTDLEISNRSLTCVGCNCLLGKFWVDCQICENSLCASCDKFAHTVLLHCPGCGV